ncbi:MAG: molecular chaperone HtpG [Crocinitomicaceae bacterium]|nr:molecular chaperone HtpG [Crocinitomicaceae bacterium]|tara:strand:- start:1802 stop:3694 length:1893 start_codon:yes stop_codon:yes gene_type:complete
MATGKINVQSENIFPIIKKFLYSDHEIFLRELVSNAVDATQKLKTLSKIGEFKGELEDTTIEVEVNKEDKTIKIIDKGIGMSEAEVKKYLNQVAFSGAEEFVKKHEGQAEQIIGHFGLGFYSAFMVSQHVTVETKSYKDEPAVIWECNGDPEFKIRKSKKENHGSIITLHIADDSLEFLEDQRISGILDKYCKFLPVEIKFGTKTEMIDDPKGEKDDKGEVKKVENTVDNIINNPSPAWNKKPSDLKTEDYDGFYNELYPMTFEKPLFNIHLNVDYPFNLTGILYFPKLSNAHNLQLQKNKIQLYSNQVFITDSVEEIVPEFLTLLHGVIDSPDIPLNVSRSYLQSDGNVKKISSHITKKVADKLASMFKKDRKDFEEKWDDIKIFMEYGMLTDEKFFDRAIKSFLLKDTEGNYYTFDEYKEKVKEGQTNKDDKIVVLYTSNLDEQHAYIDAATNKGYNVVEMASPLTAHLVQQLESKLDNVTFTRVDADTIDKLILKEDVEKHNLTEDQEKELKEIIESVVEKEKYSVQLENLSENDSPMMITQSEFMRRMKEQSAVGGGMMGMGNLPDMYNLVVNANHPLTSKILIETDAEKKTKLAKQAADLAKLSQGLLVGSELTAFVKRSVELID